MCGPHLRLARGNGIWDSVLQKKTTRKIPQKLEKIAVPASGLFPYCLSFAAKPVLLTMQVGNTAPIPDSVAKLISHRELEHYDAWQRVFGTECKDHRYYDILEQTLDGDFEYHYLLLEDRSGAIRAIQPLFFVRQNLVEGVRGKIRSAVGLFWKKFPRFLTMRVLMVGCAAGEGHLGVCSPEDGSWGFEALHARLPSIARQNKTSLLVLQDL